MRISAGKLLAVSAFLLSFGGPEARAGRDGEPPAVRAAPPARTGHQAPAVQIQAIEIQAAQGRGQGAAQGGGAVDPMVGQSRPPPSTQAPARGPGQGASGQSAQGGQGQGGQGQGAQGQGAQGQGQQAQGAQGQGAQGGQQIPGEIPKPYHGSLTFETGTGSILTLTLPAANVYVADPKVAEVRPASATSLFVFGIGAGHTTIAVVDTYGRLLADYQITVHPSGFGAREAQAAIARLIPGSNIQVKPQGKGLMLTGAVSNPADAAQAVSIARGYSTAEGGAPMPVENQMTVAAPSQVTLMVRIAEMKRSVKRNLGIDWNSQGFAQGFFGKVAGSGGLLGATLNAAASIRCGGVATSGTGGPCFDAVLNALAKDGLAHIMAEPNLTVMSGQAASFQSGGEFPIYVYGSGTGYSVTYKQYGVLLKFLPIVLSDGRINLHVAPEVSEIDSVNSAGQTPGSSSLTASALKTRRAETTVELGSGESFAIAGMLQSTGSDAGSGLPGLGDTPILGALFKTNSMIREQTELVIVVTPILVRPVKNVAQLQMPAEGYTPAGDVDRLLLMRQMPNRDGSIRSGQAGFMVR